jgi:hypothetical protein
MQSSAYAARPQPAVTRYRSHAGRISAAQRLRRIALVVSMVVLIPTFASYLGAVTQRSNSPFGIRTVEWLRDHGAAGLVANVESIYYSFTAPSKGGPSLKALPKVGYGAAGAAATSLAYRPAGVPPLLHPALPGEGVWHATRPSLEHEPPVLVTTLRDQPEYPRVYAGLAWIDTRHATIALNPGRLEPSVELPRGPMEVPIASRPRLLATFNSGFKLSDSKGGFVLGGRTYATMHNGQGTIVGYTNGNVDIIDWEYGPTPPSNVSFARQNLPLIVNEGRPAAGVQNTSEWGATVGNAVLVWRSAVGVDNRGDLIYVSGEDQSVASIADALIRAGAVRAMELDINSFWTSFITYGAPSAGEPKNLLPGMERPATRYLEPDDRDFFSVYER